jgi:hypothetical protein
MKWFVALSVTLALAVVASPSPGSSISELNLTLGVWERELPEMGRVRTGLLTVGETRYLLMPPARWRGEKDGNQAVRWLDQRASISVRLIPDFVSKDGESSVQKMRQRSQSLLQGAKMLRETVCHTEAESGQAFDLEWRDGQGALFSARVAFIRVGGRTFEFVLLAPEEQFSHALAVFNGVLTSFQVMD